MSWTNRTMHAEALETNTVGFIRLRPDTADYKSANGLINIGKRTALIQDYLKWLQEHFDMARCMITFPGDVELSVAFRTPMAGSELRDALDDLARGSRTLYPEAEPGEVAQGIEMPFTFTLMQWQQRDTETLSLGQVHIPGEER